MHASPKLRRALTLGTLVASLTLAACRTPQQDPQVLVTTQPPGARLRLEGSNREYRTPCHLPPTDESTNVEIFMDGYRTYSGPLGAIGTTAERSYDLVLIPLP